MSADRETNLDMTHRDIALLLAEAADEVEIGIAPTQTVIRGGRRRRARRWAVAAAAVLVIAGSTGALAVAGAPGGGAGHRVVPAIVPSVTGQGVTEPHRTTLSTGTEDGRKWWVSIDVWPAPADRTQARAQLDAMAEEYGEERPAGIQDPAELVGTGTYFVLRSFGDTSYVVMENSLVDTGTFTGTDLQTGAIPLEPDTDGPQRLVIGQVAKTAQRVSCRWQDGTTTELGRAPEGEVVSTDEELIRSAQGSPVDWFVCLAPKGTWHESARVTG